MNNLIKFFTLASFLGLTACSTQQAYYGLQFGQKKSQTGLTI